LSFSFQIISATCIGVLAGKEVFRVHGPRLIPNGVDDGDGKPLEAKKQVLVDQDKLTSLACGLAEILDFETVLRPPCKSVVSVVDKTRCKFVSDYGILKELPVSRTRVILLRLWMGKQFFLFVFILTN
jgi:hypothetical protein